MMKVKRFEIWLADLNPRFGTEAGKTRPVLVIQSDLLNTHHPSTIVCPITSQVRSGVHILRVNLAKGEGGLHQESAIMIDQMRSIDNRRLVKCLGNLPAQRVEQVANNLRVVLDLP